MISFDDALCIYHLQHKCEQYWPTGNGNTRVFGEIAVEMQDTELYANYIIRTFSIKRVSSSVFYIKVS